MVTMYGIKLYRQRVRQLHQDLPPGLGSGFSGRYLMNREQVGVPIRRRLEDLFFALAEPAVLIIDFAGVEEMTGSVAEEVGPKLFGAVETNRKINPHKYLIYDNLTPEIHKELDAWFARYDRCVPAFLQELEAKPTPIIGALPPSNLMEVLIYCYRHGPVTSSELEQTLPFATKKLTDLHKQLPWLLHREKERGDTPKSWRYLFIPLIPMDRVARVSQESLLIEGSNGIPTAVPTLRRSTD